MDNPSPSRQQRTAARQQKQNALRRSILFAALVPLTFVLGLAAGYFIWGRDNSPAVTAAAAPTAVVQNGQAAEAAQNQPVRRYEVPVDDDYFFGPEDAPITLIEFSDYECPYCRKWHAEVWPKLQAAFPDQIKLVYRDFPLSNIHFNASSAAEAANCAGEQDKYWEFHTQLFANEGLGDAVYAEYVQGLKLDPAAFDECMSSDRMLAEIQADFDFASQMGIQSTPTFFINGLAVIGAQPFEVFQQVIQKELAGEIP